MSGFNDKTVLITGGTSGIGRSTALGFAAAGANVVIAGRNEAPGLEVIKAAEDSPGKCSFHRADIAIESDVEELVDSVITSYGQLDIAVNTAGINPHGPLDTRSSEDFDTIFAVNTKGVFLCLKHMIRAMKASGGAILQVGSIASERSLAQRGLYCASKSAANMLVRTAAIEAAPFGIRINEVGAGHGRHSDAEGNLVAKRGIRRYSGGIGHGGLFPSSVSVKRRSWPPRSCFCVRTRRGISPVRG